MDNKQYSGDQHLHMSASKTVSATCHCLSLSSRFSWFGCMEMLQAILLQQEDVWTKHDSFLEVGEVKLVINRAVQTSLLKDEA